MVVLLEACPIATVTHTVLENSSIGFLVTSLTKALLPYIDVCVFPNHVQSIEFTTGGLQ
jgi:hypothetical protein